MSSHKKISLSAQRKVPKEILEQYLYGTLTEAQRHQIERQLLDDSFTAEAVEGLGTQKNATQMADNMADLRDRLNKRIARQDEKRQIPMPFGMQPYAIAASIAVLLVSAIVVLFSVQYFQKTHAQDTISYKQTNNAPVAEATPIPELTKEAQSETDVASKKDVTVAQTQDLTLADATQETASANLKHRKMTQTDDQHTQLSSTRNTSVATTIQTDSIALDQNKLALVLAGRTPGVAVEQDKVAHDANQSTKGSIATQPIPFAPSGEKSKLNTSMESVVEAGVQVVKGKVTDVEDGLGIPGVIVAVPGTSVSTVTDLNGMYSIQVPASQNEISFNFVGYLTYYSPVNQQKTLNARLVPDIKTLGEVVVTGSQAKSGETATAYQSAQPINPDFMKTIEQKLEASPTIFSNTSPGTIKLSFTVQPDGSLTDVKVLKGICTECDQIAVQALKESSQWKPAKENGKPVSQTMRIRIPLKGKKKKDK